MPAIERREAVTIDNCGEKIFGILHRPLTTTPAPAIVICSGFAGNKCGKFRLFVTLGKLLAECGIAVLRFDYRGSGDSEGEFSDITLEGKVSDTIKCLDFLAHDPEIDANRIGLLGRSLGGAIAILAACKYQHIKSIALWAPVFKSDPWRKLWEAKQSNQLVSCNHDILKNLPSDIPNIEFLQQFFKLKLENELPCISHIPLLHIHGDLDKLVHIEHAKDFENMRKNVQNSRFIQLVNSDHDFSDADDRKTIIQETIQWYQNTL